MFSANAVEGPIVEKSGGEGGKTFRWGSDNNCIYNVLGSISGLHV